jgi:hypothetical protein
VVNAGGFLREPRNVRVAGDSPTIWSKAWFLRSSRFAFARLAGDNSLDALSKGVRTGYAKFLKAAQPKSIITQNISEIE